MVPVGSPEWSSLTDRVLDVWLNGLQEASDPHTPGRPPGSPAGLEGASLPPNQPCKRSGFQHCGQKCRALSTLLPRKSDLRVLGEEGDPAGSPSPFLKTLLPPTLSFTLHL